MYSMCTQQRNLADRDKMKSLSSWAIFLPIYDKFSHIFFHSPWISSGIEIIPILEDSRLASTAVTHLFYSTLIAENYLNIPVCSLIKILSFTNISYCIIFPWSLPMQYGVRQLFRHEVRKTDLQRVYK